MINTNYSTGNKKDEAITSKEKEQRIFKSEKTNGNFTQVSNEIINNPNLTAQAKGIMIYLLSKPKDWKVNVKDIQNHMKNGRDAIYSILNELKKHGYIVWDKKATDEKGRFTESKIYVYETPLKQGETPYTENPYTENPYTENQDYTNKELSNKELNNINTPLTPQKRKDEQQEPKQEKQGQGQNNITRYIRNNFNKEQQAMLLSVYENEKRPKAFNEYFLKAYKKAYPKVQQERRDLRLIKSKLIELLKDIEERKVIVKESLTGLMIYRLNNDKPVKKNNEQPKNKEVIPDWFGQGKRESHKKNKQTSYETDHSKYDFSKRHGLLSDDELLKIEESY